MTWEVAEPEHVMEVVVQIVVSLQNNINISTTSGRDRREEGMSAGKEEEAYF